MWTLIGRGLARFAWAVVVALVGLVGALLGQCTERKAAGSEARLIESVKVPRCKGAESGCWFEFGRGPY